jgi:hypothetical protein
VKNYCRNPDGEKSMWCYTTDKKKRWEYCEPLECDAGEVPMTSPPKNEGVDKTTGLEYGRPFYIISKLPMGRVIEWTSTTLVIKTITKSTVSQQWFLDGKSGTIMTKSTTGKSIDATDNSLSVRTTTAVVDQKFTYKNGYIINTTTKKVIEVKNNQDTENNAVVISN